MSAALNTYQTNQNLGNLYGITSAPAQTQFLTDFNTAAATPGFQYLDPTGNAYAPTASQTFEQALTAANAAAPGKGASNALMSQFTTGQGASDNPFLGQYNYESEVGGPTNITPLTAQQLYDKQHPTPVAPYVPPLQTGQTTPIGTVFDNTKYPNIQSTGVGPDGYIHVTTTTGEYLLNPNSKRVVNFIPAGTTNTGNWSSGASGSGIAGMASGGSIQMPQEYSQGNWKLI